VPSSKLREPIVPARVKTAIAYLIEQKADLQAAAAAAGLTMRELRRSMGQPHVRRYSLEQRQLALEAFCLGSPAALTEIRDAAENSIARVNAIKAGEQLRVGAIEEGVASERRRPGLSIVLVQQDGGRLVAYEPPKPMLDVTPAPVPEAEPVTVDTMEGGDE
jgi:hypothetical protein